MRRKVAVAAAAAAVMVPVLLSPTQAFAGHCINANKPDGAGTVGDVVIDADTEEVVALPTNPGGQTAGGFADIWLDTNGDGEGDIQVVNDTFVLNNGQPSAGEAPGLAHDGGESVLPEGALSAAGDGRGVDLSD